jgi:hypothetical protein
MQSHTNMLSRRRTARCVAGPNLDDPPAPGQQQPPSHGGADGPTGGTRDGGSASSAGSTGPRPQGTPPGGPAGAAALDGMQPDALRGVLAAALAAMEDDDVQREYDAVHSRLLTSFLRTPLGYQGLLGMCKPPTSITHPLLSELAQGSFSQHATLVREAMLHGCDEG